MSHVCKLVLSGRVPAVCLSRRLPVNRLGANDNGLAGAYHHMVIEGVRREVEMADYRLLDLLGGRVAVQIEQSQGQLFAAPVDTNVNCVIHKLCHRYASSQGVDY